MRSFPINRMRYFPRASRRNLYRRCKRLLYTFARPRWRGRAEPLRRVISDFLRGRSLPFLLRVIRQHGFAMLLAAMLVSGCHSEPEAKPKVKNSLTASTVGTSTQDSAIELSEIVEDTNPGGFAINGIDSGDHSGASVSGAGDVNGDGLDDLIVGDRWADPGGISGAGQSYVVFGKAR